MWAQLALRLATCGQAGAGWSSDSFQGLKVAPRYVNFRGCRDIVEGLIVASCTRQGDFEWQRQLRTYYHVEDDTVQIKQVSC